MWSNEVCQYISFISLAVENVSSTVTTGKFSPNFCVQCPRCHCWNYILFLTTETKYLCFLWQYYLLRVLLITHTGRVIWTSFSFRLLLICLALALLLPHKVMTFPPPICNGAIGGKAYTLWSHVPSMNPSAPHQCSLWTCSHFPFDPFLWNISIRGSSCEGILMLHWGWKLNVHLSHLRKLKIDFHGGSISFIYSCVCVCVWNMWSNYIENWSMSALCVHSELASRDQNCVVDIVTSWHLETAGVVILQAIVGMTYLDQTRVLCEALSIPVLSYPLLIVWLYHSLFSQMGRTVHWRFTTTTSAGSAWTLRSTASSWSVDTWSLAPSAARGWMNARSAGSTSWELCTSSNPNAPLQHHCTCFRLRLYLNLNNAARNLQIPKRLSLWMFVFPEVSLYLHSEI